MPIFDHFDFLAPRYEKFIQPKDPDVICRLAGMPISGALLDAGGGTGRISQFLTGMVGSIVVADLSCKMLLEASRKDGLHPVCSHTEKLPFPGAWVKAELALETGVPAAPVAGTAPEVDATLLRDLNNFLANLPDGYYTVKPADLNTELAGGAALTMIDVRSAEDFTAGYIEGAVNMPITAVLADLTLLPAKDAPVVIYCASGHRGALALMALRMLGWTDVRNLGGGTGAWTAAELPLVTP